MNLSCCLKSEHKAGVSNVCSIHNSAGVRKLYNYTMLVYRTTNILEEYIKTKIVFESMASLVLISSEKSQVSLAERHRACTVQLPTDINSSLTVHCPWTSLELVLLQLALFWGHHPCQHLFSREGVHLSKTSFSFHTYFSQDSYLQPLGFSIHCAEVQLMVNLPTTVLSHVSQSRCTTFA